MSTPFFITGIPRSRTSWLANLFTTGDSFCHHDATRLGVDLPTIRAAMDSVHTKYAGDSDSGLLFCWADVVKEYPAARWVIVLRNLTEAEASFKKYFDGRLYGGVRLDRYNSTDIFKELARRLSVLTADLPLENRLIVDFRDLDNPATVKAIWNWATPENAWSDQRFEMLNTLQVNPYPEKVSHVWQ